MRFDDSLATVLAADTASPAGAAAAWRQLVDLVARGRVPDEPAAVARLRALRPRVPADIRGATGRALATTGAPAALVALFAEDDLATAAPLLRIATIEADAWLALLPALSPAARAVLRHRRDLPGTVVRGLASFGATDFVLGHEAVSGTEPFAPATVEPHGAEAPVEAEPLFDLAGLQLTDDPLEDEDAEPRFEIADLVARIDAFRREQPVAAPAAPLAVPDRFQYHTDAAGVIRWVEGVARAALIGVALPVAEPQGLAQVGPEAGHAWRARRSFRDGALQVGGENTAAGHWRLAGDPRFDPANGSFVGMAGIGRRVAAPAPASTASDMLRQLVHELRTPATAIAGFAELIGSELLGPVPPVYRDRVTLIQRQGGALTEAIADLDTAARIEGAALETRIVAVDLAPVAVQAVADLQPLAQARFVRLTLSAPHSAPALVDERGARRLIDRLLAAAVAAAMPGEQLSAQLVVKPRTIRLHIARPRALTVGDDERLLAIDAGEGGDDLLPLGVGFTLRLVRGLAAALGGSLVVAPTRLTLRLPAAVGLAEAS